MLVYTSYRWFRRKHRGPLERERQRACVVVIAFVLAILASSGAPGTFQRMTNEAAVLFYPAGP